MLINHSRRYLYVKHEKASVPNQRLSFTRHLSVEALKSRLFAVVKIWAVSPTEDRWPHKRDRLVLSGTSTRWPERYLMASTYQPKGQWLSLSSLQIDTAFEVAHHGVLSQDACLAVWIIRHATVLLVFCQINSLSLLSVTFTNTWCWKQQFTATATCDVTRRRRTNARPRGRGKAEVGRGRGWGKPMQRVEGRHIIACLLSSSIFGEWMGRFFDCTWIARKTLNQTRLGGEETNH